MILLTPRARLASLGPLSAFVLAVAGCGGSAEAVPDSSTTATAGVGGAGGTGEGGATTVGVGGAGGGTGGVLDNGAPSDVYPAKHPAPPRVISFGGPVLHAPVIYPVFFSNDDPTFVDQVEDFAARVGSTEYWKANTKEYGVGPATSAEPLELPETATGTIDDDEIQAWLADKLNSDDPAFAGAADDDAIFALHYPAGVTISLGGSKSCEAYYGYHGNFTLDAAHDNRAVAYAVMPRCTGLDGQTDLELVTTTESHELIEAATDPYPMTDPAYAQVDTKHLYWERLLGGGETADMCAQFPGVYAQFEELPYLVQRSWSNASAVAGHDPCVPALPGSVYFNSAPELNDNVTASIFGQSVPVKGVLIPVGETRAVNIDLFSDADTGGTWTVDVSDSAAVFGGQPHLTITMDRTTGRNGEILHAFIRVDEAGKHNTETFVVTSTMGSQRNFWFGIVGN